MTKGRLYKMRTNHEFMTKCLESEDVVNRVMDVLDKVEFFIDEGWHSTNCNFVKNKA